MALTKADKEKIIEKFGKNIKDTGALPVQIALLTERINYLSKHLEIHRKDFSARRTLSILVSKRKSFLNYLKKHNPEEYAKTIKLLNLE